MDSYKNRTKMIKDYQVDGIVTSREDLQALADNYEVSLNGLYHKVLAVSHGVYGANGAIIAYYQSNPDIDTQLVVAINERSTYLMNFI